MKFIEAKIDKLYRENTSNNYYFEISPEILFSLGTANEDEFFSFIGRFQKIGAVRVSKDMRTYINVSEMPITREMLLGVSPLGNPNQYVKLFGARVYVELQDETGSIIHPEGGKSLKALHPSGRTRMSWESIWQAFQDYGVENLILDSELEQYKEENGYNIGDVDI